MAKRFKFKFEVLLQVRKRNEDDKKRILARHLQARAHMQQHLDALNRQIGTEMDKFRGTAGGGLVDVSEVARRRYWISHLQHGLLEAEIGLRRNDVQLQDDRESLAAAARERRIIERLREKAQQAYDQEQARLEAIESDDLAVCRYVHERQGPGARSFSA